MKLELKEYQLGAVHDLLEEVDNAMIRHTKNSKKLFAISLSSPTGSGKTIIMTSVIETILCGSEDFEPLPDATILWVSDQPSLNEQTKRKMSMHSSQIRQNQLVTVDHSLDQRTLDKGKIYFAHIQQLGKGAKLYNEVGDHRDYRLWETISNTVRERGDKFILIIDEAHRGVNSKGKASGGTIVQQLMDGKEDKLPTPIVIGISATPGRFIESMTKDSTRTLEQVDVPTSEVQKSGLIKDKLVISHPEDPTEEDMTLLTSAIAKVKEFEKKWAEYAKEQNEPVVLPLLVIQVPPGCSDEFYRNILQKIKSEWPELPDDSIRNSMEGHNTLTINDNHRVKFISPPDIQDGFTVRIVLFKQALNTGWDCPRAEVMISFAVANDQTYVAQTIGRMVRTPLARRVGTDSFLNTVSLYLPNFDQDAVEQVVQGLNEGEGSVTSEVVVDGVTIPRNPEIPQALFDAIENLPSYSRTSKYYKNEIVRLNKIANLLSGSDIDKTANNQAREVVISTLNEHIISIDDLDEKENKIRYSDVITREHSMTGDEEEPSTSSQVPRSIEDLDGLFRAAKRAMPDDAAMTYWNALCELEEGMNTKDAKVRVISTSNDEEAKEKLDAAAKKNIEDWQKKHKEDIAKLPDAKQIEFNEIAHQAKKPEEISVKLEKNMTVQKSNQHLQKHLYATEKGVPYATGKGKFFDSTWEEKVVDSELKKDSLKGWYRNGRGGSSSIAVPYEEGDEWKTMYPDLFFVHEVDGEVVVDLYDPHSPSLADTSPKWIGLSKYARKHKGSYRAVNAVIEEDGKLVYLDLMADGVVDLLKKATNETSTRKLFKEKGTN